VKTSPENYDNASREYSYYAPIYFLLLWLDNVENGDGCKTTSRFNEKFNWFG